MPVYSASVEIGNTLVAFKKISKLFFQMSVQVYDAPNWREQGGLLNSFKFLTCGVNFNYHKIVHHLIPTHGNIEQPGNFQIIAVSSPFSGVSRYILILAKLEGRGKPFLRGARRGGWAHCEITPKRTWLS